MTIFGLADIKKEGEKLWPQSYLLLNGVLPKRSFYTLEELDQQEKSGYTDDWYGKE